MEEDDSSSNQSKMELTDKDLFKDRTLMEVFQKVQVSELEGLILITEIIRKLKFLLKYSKNRYMFTDLNSSNITLTRFFDIMINYVE